MSKLKFTFDDLPKEVEELLYDDKNYSILPEILEFVEENEVKTFDASEVPDLLEEIRDFAVSLAEKDLLDFDDYDKIDGSIESFLLENADHFNESNEVLNEDKEDEDAKGELIRRSKTIYGVPFTKYKIGEKQINLFGVELKYSIIKTHFEKSEEEKDFFEKDRIEAELVNKEAIEMIESKIKETYIKEFESLGDASIQGSKMIGIPETIELKII